MAVPRNSAALVLLLLLASAGAPAPAAALQRTRAVRVKELTDATFEHDTQAATGQTTGRWLVMFVGDELDQSELDTPPKPTPKEAPEAEGRGEEDEEEGGASREAAADAPLSSAALIHSAMLVASQLPTREFLPAIVHVPKNPVLRKRFGVASTPCVKLFRDRKMYSFQGVPRSPKELRHFLEVGYSGAPAEEVPPEPSFWERLVEDLPHKYKIFREVLLQRPWLMPVVCLAVVVVFYSLTAKALGLGKSPKSATKKPSAKRAAKRD